ncbi:MAG TPA: hypothetical protein VM779_02365 [Thermoanaerobaculia bacterium]|nr:hypothetical protein [Thermoanaerobaculia bacterium]
MPFPDHIERVLDAFGVPAYTKAALFDLYLSMGNEVLEVFSDIAETVASPTQLRPEDTLLIRHQVVERYLRKNHPHWLRGTPTPSLWFPRLSQGRASGLVTPLGAIPDAARLVVGDAQPVPDGVLMLSRNAHFGGRDGTISFDVVPVAVEEAVAVGQAEGQQHTLPGSVGETSGTLDADSNVALIWEIQPNVYKPAGERNRAISRIYRRHRNWHLVTLASALSWLRDKRCTIFLLRGEALAATHEVNPAKPVSETIVALHNRTIAQVTEALGVSLSETTVDDAQILVNAEVMNHALGQHVGETGAGGVFWRVVSKERMKDEG